jgi:hypothetical protein
MERYWGTQGALALADRVIGDVLMYPSILLHQGLMEPLLYRCIKTMVVMVVIFWALAPYRRSPTRSPHEG